tara:strand:+ start:1439 stop:2077 length:639 start_codon:yes stop_codon:yes gene_type:complete
MIDLETIYQSSSIVSAIFSGFFLFITLVLIKQNWVSTFQYFLTFLLLPITAMFITKIISNNLALSLGMVGALSIVRFRNPVKSPLELVMYFILITSGVIFGVNMKLGLLFIFIVIAILFLSKLFEFSLSKIDKIELFRYSFSSNDNERRILLEIDSKKKIDLLENHKNLEYFSTNKNTFFYKISFKNINEANNLKGNLLNNEDITNVEIRYN